MTHEVQRHNHLHNGHKGRVQLARQSVISIHSSKTVTEETRQLAAKVISLMDSLDESLSSRVNLDGSIRRGLYKQPTGEER